MRRIYVYLAFGALLILSLGVAAANPLAFQKLNTLARAGEFESLRSPAAPVDIAPIIGNTPYRAGSAATVSPEKKSRRTLEEGTGNCSEKAFGLAWKLRNTDTDYQIIHLMHPDGITRGFGHTMIRIPYIENGETRIGLVDLFEGGIPTSGDRPLDIADLTNGPITDFQIRSMTPLLDDDSPYYGEFLEGVSVGYIRSSEVNRYFDFMEKIYIPLGHDRLEKIVYDGVTLLFGYLPKVYTPEYDALVEANRVEVAVHSSALWVQRSSLLMFPLFLGFEVSGRVRLPRRSRAWFRKWFTPGAAGTPEFSH